MVPHERRWTRDDLADLPESCRAEIVEGVLVMPAAPDPYHQGLVLDLAWMLRRHLGAASRDRLLVAPVDVVIDDENVVQPDVLVLPEGTRRTPPPWRIPCPVWVAEVLSPASGDWDRGPKLRAYGRAGLREVWLLDPAQRTITVCDPARGTAKVASRGQDARSGVLPGFGVLPAALFQE